MTVVSIILGVLLVICGFLVMFTPILSFFGLGTVIAVALMIWGIMALVKCVRIRIYGFRCAMAILAIIIAFLLMVTPGETFLTDQLILYLAAVFVIARGLLSIILAVKSAKESPKRTWIIGIILGILAVILGIICLAYPLFEAGLISFMIAFFCIYVGIDMIYVGFRNNGDDDDSVDGNAGE